MKRSIPQFILAAVLALGCFVNTASAAKQVPIKGKFKGTVQATPIATPPGALRLVATGVGSVSHLGRATAQVIFPAALIDLTAGELILLEHEWTGTITAANGDQIFGRYTLASDTLSISPSGEVFYQADLTVTGGTGRFQNATGTAVATGVGNLSNFTFVVEVSGAIGTVGSSKK